jgi:hypothetical protein
MKPAALIFLILFSLTCRADPPKTREDFEAAIRSAFDAKDIQRIHDLTWEKGMSDFDRDQEKQMLPMMLDQSGGVASISFEPLPSDFMDTPVAWGRRIEVTHPADGMVKLVEKPKGNNSSSEMSMPYAVIDGGYYLVTAKTTDLCWKGPPDKSLQVAVQGAGQDKVKIHVKYNASGVDIDMDPTSPSISFAGQYIRQVTVKSDRDDTNVTLQLLDENGHSYYESAPLRGKGEIDYNRGDTSPQAK